MLGYISRNAVILCPAKFFPRHLDLFRCAFVSAVFLVLGFHLECKAGIAQDVRKNLA